MALTSHPLPLLLHLPSDSTSSFADMHIDLS
jgi:hypothetical protein